MLVAGVDDAGRGAVIGPLVIAGVLLEKNSLYELTNLGVKDSKLLSPSRREQLADEIEKIAIQHHVIKLPPAEIDRVVETGKRLHKLNRLEAQTMGEVLTILKPEVAYVDASDVWADRFGAHVQESMPFTVQMISEHKADVKYPIVSAASILAKVARDQEISKLKEEYGAVGCGYATDQRTLEFLERLLRETHSYPGFVRKSWAPAKRVKRQVSQTRLL
jgi:ribonuclease HII